MSRLPYLNWTVKEQDYKLKLSTSEVIRLEQKYKTNLINTLQGGIPSLTVMLDILHASMTKYNANVKLKDVYDIYDDYLDDGGSQTSLLTDVVMEVFQVSGFFTQEMEETMSDKLESAKRNH